MEIIMQKETELSTVLTAADNAALVAAEMVMAADTDAWNAAVKNYELASAVVVKAYMTLRTAKYNKDNIIERG